MKQSRNDYMPIRVVAIIGCAAACCALTTQQAALAQSPQKTQIISLSVGFGGAYKVGVWNQLEVTLVGGIEQATGLLQATVADSDGVPTTFTSPASRPVGVTPGQATTARLFVRPGQTDGQIRVRFIDGATGKIAAERKFFSGPEAGEGVVQSGMPSVHRLVVAFGSPVGLGDVVRTGPTSFDDAAATRVAQLDDARQLPLAWYGYEGVDTVILATSRPEIYRSLSADSERIAAIERWVELGGNLVIFCGREAPELIGPAGPLRTLAPGEFVELAPLRTTLPLENFAGSEDALNRGRIDLRVPKLAGVHGSILAYEGKQADDLPLVVRTRRGLGQITFVAVDPDLAPLSNWSGRVSLLRKAIGWPAPTTDQLQDQDNALVGQGFQDLSGQLRTALDGKFVGIQTAPFALVALLVVVYIALIGPGDYFFVKRVLRRMELTWITFPLCVAAVSIGAYYLAYTMKGDQLRVNQVEIVDVDVAAGNARGTVWTHFFSPRVDNYNLTLKPRFAGEFVANLEPTLVSWLGMPGYGLGGMQSGAARTSLFDRGYAFAPSLDAMLSMPVQEWSTKTITARWNGGLEKALEAALHPEDDELLAGRITNQTGVDLSECFLLYGRWAYRLDRIADGATAIIDDSNQPRTVKTQLTSARAGDEKPNQTADDGTVEFDMYGADVTRLVKLMMFYEAAGGRTYAATWNRYQHFVDMSSLLDDGQAILLARAFNAEGSRWFDDDRPLASDDDRNWTFYRFVIPVKKQRVVTVPRPL